MDYYKYYINEEMLPIYIYIYIYIGVVQKVLSANQKE